MTSLNSTPTSERVQIGIFGKVNAGKSSVLNAMTGQDMAVVSEQEGTTTDPVKKAMELLPIGPVMLYDTPGLADGSRLGEKRQQKTEEILRRVDVGLVVVDAALMCGDRVENGRWLTQGTTKESPQKQKLDKDISDSFLLERELIKKFRQRNLPYLVIANKIDRVAALESGRLAQLLNIQKEEVFPFSCKKDWQEENGNAVQDLRQRISQIGGKSADTLERHLVSDLIEKGDVVLLVIPIDESAPKGRLILPQQQVIRDILDTGAIAMSVQPSELPQALDRLKKAPKLVVTDSQAFGQVSKLLPREIPLTSFSILMARYKGDLEWQAAGAKTIDRLDAGARILISEGCTHHRQCGDIGTVKLPGWIQKYTGKEFDYHFTSGGEFPGHTKADEKLPGDSTKSEAAEQGNDIKLSDYALVIHCGGCTLPPQEMAWRLSQAKAAGVPMTNYGTMIAYLHGILERAMEPLGATE